MPGFLIEDGRVTVTTPGKAVQLSDAIGDTAAWLYITALEGNTDKVVIGGSDVVAALATRKGTPLAPGAALSYPLSTVNPQNVYVDAVHAGDGVSWTILY